MRSCPIWKILALLLTALPCGQIKADTGPSPMDYCTNLTLLAEQKNLEQDRCGIVRGPSTNKKIALLFTGGSFAESYPEIKKALEDVKGKASFFLTGDFLRNPKFKPLVRDLKKGGHYIGPHSDKHLEPVDDQGVTRITKAAFHDDIQANLRELAKIESLKGIKYWIVPSEAYNEEIARWSLDERLKLINFSKGTRSNADYMDDKDPGFVSNDAIYQSILDRETSEGLNGFLLLFHLGAGPDRTLPFSRRIVDLLHELKLRGYRFVRVDELLNPAFDP